MSVALGVLFFLMLPLAVAGLMMLMRAAFCAWRFFK